LSAPSADDLPISLNDTGLFAKTDSIGDPDFLHLFSSLLKRLHSLNFSIVIIIQFDLFVTSLLYEQ